MKLTFYDNGIPEKCAEKMVAEMFKDWMEQKPNWHYRDAYDNFVKLHPRAATGNPGKGGARHIYPRDLRKEAMKIPGCLSMGSTVQITEAQGLK